MGQILHGSARTTEAGLVPKVQPLVPCEKSLFSTVLAVPNPSIFIAIDPELPRPTAAPAKFESVLPSIMTVREGTL